VLAVILAAGCAERPLEIPEPASDLADVLSVDLPDLATPDLSSRDLTTPPDLATPTDMTERPYQWTVVWRQPQEDLNAVWGSGAGVVYAVGHSIVHTADGMNWTQTTIGMDYLNGVWATGKEAWACGQYGVLYHTADEGAFWSRTASVDSGGHVVPVWGSSRDDLYLGGDETRILHSVDDGMSWGRTVLGTDNAYFLSIWGSGPDDVWAGTNQTPVFHSVDRGGSWQPVAVGWGIASIGGSGPDEIYLLQRDGTLLRSIDRGASFSSLMTGVKSATTIWATAPGEVFVGSTDGAAVRHSRDGGRTWVSEVTGVDYFVDALWGTGAGDLWAVGTGSISHRTYR
jgi:photosystem II stability/assembly factor-like uncharacterized protein